MIALRDTNIFFPQTYIPAAAPQAAIYIIAERTADLIKAANKDRKHHP